MFHNAQQGVRSGRRETPHYPREQLPLSSSTVPKASCKAPRSGKQGGPLAGGALLPDTVPSDSEQEDLRVRKIHMAPLDLGSQGDGVQGRGGRGHASRGRPFLSAPKPDTGPEAGGGNAPRTGEEDTGEGLWSGKKKQKPKNKTEVKTPKGRNRYPYFLIFCLEIW